LSIHSDYYTYAYGIIQKYNMTIIIQASNGDCG